MPRNIVFVAPFPAETTMRFLRAVAGLHDVRVLGVVHTPPQGVEGKVEGQSPAGGMAMVAQGIAWPALLRKLDRIDSSFRN